MKFLCKDNPEMRTPPLSYAWFQLYPIYIQTTSEMPEIRTPLNQDTMHGPSYIEKCTKLPPEMRTPPRLEDYIPL